MLQEDGSLLFADFHTGQVKHPLYGYELLENVEILENRGIAKLQNRLTPRTSITVTATPIAEVKDNYGNTYTLTGHSGSGTCYKNGVSIQAGLSNAWDLAVHKDYLFVRHAGVLSAYGPLSSLSAQWFGNLETGFTNGYNGKLLTAQDGYLYSTNGNYVARMDVTASAPGVAPVLSTNLTALNLRDGEFASTIVEHGKNIIVGVHGGQSYFDRGNYQIAKLYPWNRQLGTLGNPGIADLPVDFLENGINAVVSHANKLYVQAGTNGNVYVTDSTQYTLIKRLPYARSGILSNSTVFSNAMSISAKSTLLIGLSGGNDEFSRMGVYEIDINDPEYPVQVRTISTGRVGTTASLNIGFVSQTSYQTISVGWQDGSSYGVDDTDYRLYTTFGGKIKTRLAKAGTSIDKKTFEHIEWCLAEPLVDGQNLRISYRKNSKDAFEEIGTWGYDTNTVVGEVLSHQDSALVVDAEYVQLLVELDQSLLTTYGSNVNLISVRLY